MEKELEKIFENFLEKLDRTQRKLEEKIIENIEKEEELKKTDIYVGLEEKKNIPDGFFPSGRYLCWNKENFYEEFSIYLDEKYSKILEIILNDKVYRGYFIDEGDIKYAFEYKVLHNKSFLNSEKELKEFLFANNMEITPIFNPYARKVFNIKIINILDNVDKKIIKKYDLGEFEEKYKVKKDYIPIWNVELKEDEIVQLSVVPDKKTKLFCIEAAISSETMELYKSKETIIDHFVKNDNFIKIYFAREIKRWDICKIYNVLEEKVGYYTNKTFNSDILNKIGSYTPKTKFEIERKIKILADILNIKYIEYTLEKEKSNKKIEKYIKDFMYVNNIEITFLEVSGQRKNIYLKFVKNDESLFEDKVNFLLAYMTVIYPEINWIGAYNE